MEEFFENELVEKFEKMVENNEEFYFETEEFEEIMSILKENNCTIDETLMGPDCDLIHCTVQSVRFDVIRTIDGNGSFIYCDNSDGMRFIENMFEMK